MLRKILTSGAVFFLVAGSVLVYCHQTYPALRASFVLGKDLFVGFLTLAGLAVAAENLRRTAVATRTSVALRFVERWNDPQRAALRDAWHKLYEALEGLSAPDVVKRLKSNDAERTTLTEVFNFFEETAHAVNTHAADKDLLESLLGETVRGYYAAAEPWIKERRTDRPDAWEQLETCWVRKAAARATRS